MKFAVFLLTLSAGLAAACEHEKDYKRCISFWKQVHGDLRISDYYQNDAKLSYELTVSLHFDLRTFITADCSHCYSTQRCLDRHCEKECLQYPSFFECVAGYINDVYTSTPSKIENKIREVSVSIDCFL